MGRYLSTTSKSINPAITKTPDIFGTGAYRVFTSSDAFTVPTGVGKVRVTVMGAGGGGGGNWRAYQTAWFAAPAPYNGAGTGYPGYKGSISTGGAGGGGGFSIGTATVTPGCVCCIVIGSPGTTGINVARYCNSCYNFGSACVSVCTALCAPDGTAGGYTCAFGICATGGAGGQGGKCGIYSLCCNFSDYCQCTACSIVGCACYNCCVWADLETNCLPNAISLGGAGGMGYGGFYNVCGGSGSNGNFTTISLSSFPCFSAQCCYSYVTRHETSTCSGAPGGILGTPVFSAMPNIFNNKAFDGSTDTESTLLYKYDLQPSKWPGERIYTQAPGTSGSTCYQCCIYSCCCYGGSCYTACTTKCMALYSGAVGSDLSLTCCVAQGYYWFSCAACTINNYGAGGLPPSYCGTSSYDASGWIKSCWYNGTCIVPGAGFAVVEW